MVVKRSPHVLFFGRGGVMKYGWKKENILKEKGNKRNTKGKSEVISLNMCKKGQKNVVEEYNVEVSREERDNIFGEKGRRGYIVFRP